MLDAAAERGHSAILRVLTATMRERFGYSADFAPVRDAVRGRDGAQVAQLLQRQPELAHAADALGNGGLHWAALTRQPDLIDLFLNQGADINARRGDGQTPLHVSINGDYWYRWNKLPPEAISNQWTITGYLLGKGAEYDFHTACAMGDGETVARALTASPSLANRLSTHGQSPLYFAARFGHKAVCRMLLLAGADPNQPEDLAPLGHALFSACQRNNLELVNLLLEAGADANGDVDSSGSCLTIVEANHPETCQGVQNALREAGALTPPWAMDAGEFKTRLRDGSANTEMITYHILAQEDPETFDLVVEFYGDQLQTIAPTDVYGGDVPPPDQLQQLINHGLDPSRPNWIGRTFLHTCACKGAIASAKVLLDNGADIDAVDLETGGTPLAEAVRHGHLKMASFLLDAGADPAAPATSPWATPTAAASASDNAGIRTLFESI